MEQGSSSERYTRNYNSEQITVHQLQYFKEYTLDETKLLIFKILRNLPTDVHLPILIILDQYEEWKIIEVITAEYNYEYSSSELSDPEEEYERRLIKQFSSNWWDHYSSGNETD